MLLRHDLKDLVIPFKGSNTIKTNYSEVFQDIFVLQCLNGKTEGIFLEIGAGSPVDGNNTYLLEKEFGWRGLSVDYDWNWAEFVECEEVPGKQFTRDEFLKFTKEKWYKERSNSLLLTDAITCDWNNVLDDNIIDYLQVDIDPPGGTYECLERLPFNTVDFKVITYEHDAYREPEWRLKSRKFLESKGYVLIAGNISKEYGSPFEDWWVNLKYINEINSSITRNTFEESLPVMKYMFNK